MFNKLDNYFDTSLKKKFLQLKWDGGVKHLITSDQYEILGDMCSENWIPNSGIYPSICKAVKGINSIWGIKLQIRRDKTQDHAIRVSDSILINCLESLNLAKLTCSNMAEGDDFRRITKIWANSPKEEDNGKKLWGSIVLFSLIGATATTFAVCIVNFSVLYYFFLFSVHLIENYKFIVDKVVWLHNFVWIWNSLWIVMLNA